MKKFLFRIVLFFALILVVDVVVGKVFAYMVDNAKGGDNGRNNYICNTVNADVLVFGSSRAFHHYNPIIIEDSLGKSCYNCGQDGNGSILNYGRYQLICQRYSPKLVIYDVIPAFDLLAGDDNHKYLSWLKAYYDRQGVPEVFESVDPTEKYKMQSKMYSYNSKFIQMVSDVVHPLQEDGINGFRPVDKEFDTMKVREKEDEKSDFKFDSLKITYINKMVDESPDTKFIFTVSPVWYGMDSAQLQPIKEICKRRNIPFLDFSNNPKYVHNNDYFYDGSHLNIRGADEFTRDLMTEVRRRDLLNDI